MIEIINATVVKTGRKLFEDFSFRIAPGENWTIQGENGSGKTALLQLIAGAIHPQSGHVRHSFINGRDWDSLYQQRLEKIHFIPAQWIQAFLGGFGGLFYQQRYYAMDDRHLPTVRDIFEDDVEKLQALKLSSNFNIDSLLALPITRLSNGQLKKVVILRQMAKNIPNLLILDYPFDGLDAESRTELSTFIDDISQRFGIQIILVDHGEALPKVINRRLVLRQFCIEKIEAVVPQVTRKASAQQVHSFTDGVSQKEPLVEMDNVTISYDGKKIIEGLNWRINRGERWALTGKNGSGKTTLFSLIYADHPMAYSEKVYLFGKRRGSGESIWDIKKRINYFGPEQIHFLNAKTIHLPALEYILTQHAKDRSRLDALISFFGAHHFINDPVRFLSSGQLQLVLLINMLLDEKELLLLDEPFQFLDPVNHEKVTRYLNHYLNRDVTLVLITHDEKDVVRWTQKRKRI